ncbi:MAG: hypothetical protein RML38_10625 [Bacteroidia bacterium]|nr:hypothetical protein [Bacteroidia bacterium]
MIANMRKWLIVGISVIGILACGCNQKPCPGVGGPAPKQSKKMQKAFRKHPVKTQQQ